MHPQQVPLDSRLLAYLVDHSTPLPSGVEVVMSEAEEMGMASMQISADQALLMRLLLRLIGARRVLEIGTFLGLSALVIADAVGPDGKVVCLDINEEWSERAQRLWEAAGVAARVDLRVGDAHQTLRNVTDTFDAVFLDADKTGYLAYLEAVSPLLRAGGLLLVDNTLWYGRVADPAVEDENTVALRRFNRALAADPRYEVTMVPVGDGLTVARRI